MNCRTNQLTGAGALGPKNFMVVFYTWVIPAVWGTQALLTVLFPGGENIGLASSVLPGVYFGKGSSLPIHLIESAVTMVIAGAVADWRRVVWTRWLRCNAFSASLVFCLLTLSFASEVMRTSLANASSRFNLDDVTRTISLLLICLNGGLYFGTVFAVILTFKSDETRTT